MLSKEVHSLKTSELRTNVQGQSFHHVMSNSSGTRQFTGESTIVREPLCLFG